MFIENKYFKWYNNIIHSAQNRLIESEYETHHIVPRSMGGKDVDENLVRLTLKEHLVCHLLLTKFTYGENRSKMLFAANMMTNFGKYNSKSYSSLKKEVASMMSEMLSGINHPMYGKKQSQETIQKRIQNTDSSKLASQSGKKGPLHPSYGRVMSEEEKEMRRKSLTGSKKPPGFAVGEKNNNYGKRRPGSRTGEKNAMFGLFGENNPNYGRRASDEQKYNMTIGKIKNNIDVYIRVVNLLSDGDTVENISAATGISVGVIYKIKNGKHVIHEYIRRNDAV
jgi:hypothetical protein